MKLVIFRVSRWGSHFLDAKIGDNVVINKAIIGGEAKIRKDCKIGNGEKISVIASKEDVKSGTVVDEMEV